MAKRSKKKNPNALSEQQKADIRHNQTLDLKKEKLDKKLNITVGIVIAIAAIALLLLPALNMNFSGSLKDLLGDAIAEGEDQEMAVALDMTYFDFLFAMTKGYKDSIEYIVNSNSSGIGATVLYNAFMLKVTQEDIDMLDSANRGLYGVLCSVYFALCFVCRARNRHYRQAQQKSRRNFFYDGGNYFFRVGNSAVDILCRGGRRKRRQRTNSTAYRKLSLVCGGNNALQRIRRIQI